MKENQEDWEKQLDTVIIEIVGMNEIFSSQFIQVLSKLEGVRSIENIDFELFRKTIFECLSLLSQIKRTAYEE